MTYDELAAKTGRSPATLKRAASGRTAPSRETAMAFVSACGSRPADLNAVWLKARIAERGRLKRLRRPRAPELERPLVGDDLVPRACCQQVGEHVSERSVRRGFRPRGIDELPEAVEWHGPPRPRRWSCPATVAETSDTHPRPAVTG
ncbi:helix-turn-helix domain-containing protein [Streptomyces sp. JL4002]|uniref:helix-turn-helix domain-containing protein n=1 Tax=Streptomyces sp. JL4002 TaxID=3404781 RepID=UPI003B2811BE